MAAVELPTEGVLWTWTVQAFEPKAPFVAPADGFQPFPVGYVDLGDVMVEARLDAPPEELSVGQPMRAGALRRTARRRDDAVLGYAFAPQTEATA